MGGSYLRYRNFKPVVETTKLKLEDERDNRLGEVEKNEVMLKLPTSVKEKEANKRKGILNDSETPNNI